MHITWPNFDHFTLKFQTPWTQKLGHLDDFISCLHISWWHEIRIRVWILTTKMTCETRVLVQFFRCKWLKHIPLTVIIKKTFWIVWISIFKDGINPLVIEIHSSLWWMRVYYSLMKNWRTGIHTSWRSSNFTLALAYIKL